MKSIQITTNHQIGLCHQFIDPSHRACWAVESEAGTIDTNGNLIEYTDRLDQGTCTCPSFMNRKGAGCKHINCCRAAQAELDTAMTEMRAKISAQAPQVDLVTRARVAAASERAAQRPASRAKANSQR